MKHWRETREVLDALAALRRDGRRAAMATVIRVRGSAYRHEGAKMLVREDGSTVGNVSGGCLEQDVREVALTVLGTGRAERRSYCSGSDLIQAWDLGVGCDGEVEVFVELVDGDREVERRQLDERAPFAVCSVVAAGTSDRPRRMVVSGEAASGTLGSAALDAAARARAGEGFASGRSGVHELAGASVFIESFEPPPQLVIFGAGDDARPLAAFAAASGFRVIVVDRRPAYLAAGRFPDAQARIECRPEDLLAVVPLDRSCYAVTMTHNFADDRGYMRALVQTDVSYIGILGPRQRTERILQGLADEGVIDDAGRARIHGPVGLDIGADGGEQVALSVLAEILAVHAGRRAEPLRARLTPIHDPRD